MHKYTTGQINNETNKVYKNTLFYVNHQTYEPTKDSNELINKTTTPTNANDKIQHKKITIFKKHIKVANEHN